ncbi:predicted protein [Naegleria gruberi]|uniref:Predicted protein n=1 Tax=Naegleria gruberi TaxID=5762 RepID=D2VXI8_NAEGR|nr:uncharacterized protein NAEGRDRAFT_81606 [Naegleria gruberi]EFC38445.1 predicted protein [Naegleria gruberi]|eukprot:XP_002671189.1 predicted protein [Naegleria gruberi strain NEG-M]
MVRFSSSELFSAFSSDEESQVADPAALDLIEGELSDDEEVIQNAFDQHAIPVQFKSQKKKKIKRKQKTVKKEKQIIYEFEEQVSAPKVVKSTVEKQNNQQEKGLLDEVRFNFPICFSKNLWKDVVPEQITTYQVDSNYISDVMDISFNYHRLSEARSKIFKEPFKNFTEAVEELVRIPRFRERTTSRKLNSSSTNLLSQSRSIERKIFSCVAHNFSYILEKKENTLHFLIYDSARNTLVDYLNFEKLFFLKGKHSMIKLDLEFNSDYKIAKFADNILIFCGDHSLTESEYLEQGEVENAHFSAHDRVQFRNIKADEMIIYKIIKVDTPKEIAIVPCFSINKDGDNCITKRSDYSVNSTNGSFIYVFGGVEKNGKLSNALFMLTRSTTHNGRLDSRLQNNECAPCPRYKHSSCMIISDLFIYGGIGENGKVLNDLYRFKDGKWVEIIVDSLLPSPTADCSLFSDSRNVYLFQKNSDSYCIEVNEKNPSWKILNGLIKEKRDGQPPIKIDATSSIFELSDEGLHFCPKYLFDFRSQRTSLPQFLMEKRNEYYMVDMAFKLEDSLNDLSDYILAHKCVILARCPGLYKYIEETNQELEKEEFIGVIFPNDDKATIPLVRVLPGYEPVFKTYLDFLYCGEIIVTEAKNVPLLLDLARILSPESHYPFFLKLFNKSTKIDMSLCRESIREYEKNFENLFKNNTGSDLALVFPDSHPNIELDDCGMVADQEKIPTGALNVHRLFLSRSPYLSRVFVTSRMSEAMSNVVYMEEYSYDAFKKMVEFFYTDKIQLDGQNCLATLIYSSLFECEDLLSCSRSVATELIDTATVWAVMGIALHYQDPGLQIACEDYIIKNNSLMDTRDFHELPKDAKRRIKEQFKKKKPNKKK